MKKINPKNVYYIKLGSGNSWADECIDKGIIRLGFGSDRYFDTYQEKNWDELPEFLKENVYKNINYDTKAKGNIQKFFEADENTLWITFHNGSLYWAISKSGVEGDSSGAYLETVEGWKNTDIEGESVFQKNRLSGVLTKTEGYRGTICGVGAQKYLIKKINAEENEDVKKAEEDKASLIESIGKLIQHLQPKDFEELVDLILSRKGAHRITKVGGTQKDIDMGYLIPILKENVFVQVKNRANQNDFDECVNTFEDNDFYRIMYFIHHSGKIKQNDNDENINIIGRDEIAEWCIDTGYMSWLIEKTA